MEIKVNIKYMGKKKKSVEPKIYQLMSAPSTVKELILAVTQAGVEDYNLRQENKELLTCLTRQEIEDKAEAGKISFGTIYGDRKADLKEAQDNAIQCFEDGIYRIFLDNRPLEFLDEPIEITGETVFTFVRLIMLAGRMW